MTDEATHEATDDLLLNAYLDGELDAEAALALEQRLAHEPKLAAARDRLTALQGAFAAARAAEPTIAPPKLQRGPLRRPRPRAFPALFAALVSAAALLSASTAAVFYFTGVGDPHVAPLVDDHRRALLAANPVDLVSADHHQVRPWSATRLGISPAAPDLSKDGFTLVGVRISVVGAAPTPTVVYRAGAHLISVFDLPRRDTPRRGHTARDGFSVTCARAQERAYCIVTDAAEPTRDSFARAFAGAAE